MSEKPRVFSIGTQVIATAPDGPGRSIAIYEAGVLGSASHDERVAAAKLMAAGVEHLPVLVKALRRIQDAIGRHIRPDAPMTSEQFIDEVLAAADAQEVVRAMRAIGAEDAP